MTEPLTNLNSFLHYPLHSTDAIFERFLTLENAVCYGDTPERFVYVKGHRRNKVVLVAHADTVWEGFNTLAGQLAFNSDERCYYSTSSQYGIGADDRAGCAMLWQLRTLGHSLLITDGEEQGLLGCKYLSSYYPEVMAELNEHQFMVQFDRSRDRDFKCYDIGTDAFREYIGEQTQYTEPNRYSRTDIVGLCQYITGVNLSIGYRNEHTPQERLYIDDWLHTLALCQHWLSEPNLPKFIRY